jgi:hypothetical protein
MTTTPIAIPDTRLETLLLEGLAAKRLPLDAAFSKSLEAKTRKILDKHTKQR